MVTYNILNMQNVGKWISLLVPTAASKQCTPTAKCQRSSIANDEWQN